MQKIKPSSFEKKNTNKIKYDRIIELLEYDFTLFFIDSII